MNFLKRTMALITVLLLLSSSTYAEETKTLSLLATTDGENISVVESDITSEVDNSNMNVKVVKYVNDVEQIIYQGPLGGYDNGIWNFTDFSKIQFMVIFNWEEPDDGGIYVVPINETVVNEVQSAVIESDSDGEKEEPVQATLLNSEIIQPSLNIVESFYINNSEITNNFTSQNLKGNDTLFARYTITNSGTLTQSVQLILCVYSTEGRLLDMAVISDTIASNETKDIEKSLTVASNVSACYAKVFLWDGLNTLRPLHDTVQIGSENSSIEVATATVDCTLNKEYSLVTTVENMPTNDDGQYTITYNPSKLELVDLCSLTYKKELTAGVINGTNITIVSVDTTSGKIVFKNPNADAGNVSKVLNSFKFRGLVSNEETTITIE